MVDEQIRIADLDTYLTRGSTLTRINPRAYPLDWSTILRRALAVDHWQSEMIPVLIGDGVLVPVTDREMRRAWRRGDPCGVIERVEITDDDDRLIVAAMPAGKETTNQELRVYASSHSSSARLRSIITALAFAG